MKAVRCAILMVPLLIQASLGVEPFQHHGGNVQKLGIVVFHISCSPAVQDDFQHGVALLHSFAYEDATVTNSLWA